MVNCYNASYATSCVSGYSPLNGICKTCAKYSATCNGLIILSCIDGYYIRD